MEADGGIAAQPAPGLGQFYHIIPDSFGNGLPFQLREHGDNKHHRPPHGGTGVKLLSDGDERDAQLCELVNKAGKVADIAADSIQAIDHNGLIPLLTHLPHHLLKRRPLKIAAGKPFIFKYLTAFQICRSVNAANVFLAELNLISNTLAFPGEL